MGLHFIKNGTKHDVCVKRPSLFPASATTYDNSQSGLSATRVQGAIDEAIDDLKVKSVTITPETGWQSNGDTLTYGWTRGKETHLMLSMERPNDRTLASGWTVLGKVIYAPSSNVSFPAILFSSGNTYVGTVRLELDTSGNISVYCPSPVSSVMRVVSNITYLSTVVNPI